MQWNIEKENKWIYLRRLEYLYRMYLDCPCNIFYRLDHVL